MLLAVQVTAQAQKTSDHNFEVAKHLDIFNHVYKNLELLYVDTLKPKETIGTGITAMLRSLDPYTEYYAQDETKDLRMMLTGKYAGIGALIRKHQKLDRVVIDEPYANMPAAEAGLKKGDVILSIDDSMMTTKPVGYVSDHLRGEPGTSFLLKVMRPSTGKLMSFKITRRNIKLPEMPYYGIREGNIGYINLNQFTEGCAKEMRRVFVDLKKQGATSLILDLRGNGGGSEQEAVDILNLWLQKGITVVENRGKLKQTNKEYKTMLEPVDTVMPLVVLVNGETASASEITSGAIQDLDRGIILGTRTYGKGLVQIPIDLPYNTNMKVTTSKYYIPSGRCIQAINYRDRRELGKDGRVPDSLTNVFHTRGGREVRDGGGIKPDIEVKHDTMANVVYYLSNDDVLVDWGTQYAQKHATIPPVGTFTITDADFEQLKTMAREADFKYDRLSEKRLDDLKKMMQFEGYYDDATAEFEALERKLTHNMDQDFDRRRKDIEQLMAHEVVKRYYYQRGSVQQSLIGDDDLERARQLLDSPDEYSRILHPQN